MSYAMAGSAKFASFEYEESIYSSVTFSDENLPGMWKDEINQEPLSRVEIFMNQLHESQALGNANIILNYIEIVDALVESIIAEFVNKSTLTYPINRATSIQEVATHRTQLREALRLPQMLKTVAKELAGSVVSYVAATTPNHISRFDIKVEGPGVRQNANGVSILLGTQPIVKFMVTPQAPGGRVKSAAGIAGAIAGLYDRQLEQLPASNGRARIQQIFQAEIEQHFISTANAIVRSNTPADFTFMNYHTLDFFKNWMSTTDEYIDIPSYPLDQIEITGVAQKVAYLGPINANGPFHYQPTPDLRFRLLPQHEGQDYLIGFVSNKYIGMFAGGVAPTTFRLPVFVINGGSHQPSPAEPAPPRPRPWSQNFGFAPAPGPLPLPSPSPLPTPPLPEPPPVPQPAPLPQLPPVSKIPYFPPCGKLGDGGTIGPAGTCDYPK